MNLVRFNNPRYNANRVLVDELFNNFLKNDYQRWGAVMYRKIEDFVTDWQQEEKFTIRIFSKISDDKIS